MKCIEKSMENIITSVRVDRVKEFSSGESMKFLFVHFTEIQQGGAFAVEVRKGEKRPSKQVQFLT